MGVLGNFPAAPAEELPAGVVGYLHYNNGSKLPLTKVEVIPDVTTVQKTIAGVGKALYWSFASGGLGNASGYLHIATEDGYYKQLTYSGSIAKSEFRGYPLTAQSRLNSTLYAYDNDGVHYLQGGSKWTCTEHGSRIISCDGSENEALSVDENGTILCNTYASDDLDGDGQIDYVHQTKWSTNIEGCTLVCYNYCAVVGSVLKLLNELDGSIIAEVDIGHNIVCIEGHSGLHYIYCDDGYVFHYERPTKSYKYTTDTIDIIWSHDFGKPVNYVCELEGKYLVCYADGTVAKVTLDFKDVWSYTGNTSAALFVGAYGWSAKPSLIVAREDGNIEILSITPGGVKVYFDNAALDEGTSE
jgi:hypothetical protein